MVILKLEGDLTISGLEGATAGSSSRVTVGNGTAATPVSYTHLELGQARQIGLKLVGMLAALDAIAEDREKGVSTLLNWQKEALGF